MSSLKNSLNPQAELSAWAHRLTHMFVKDLEALSQNQYETPYQASTRSACDLTAEVTDACLQAAAMLRGEKPELPSEEKTQQRARELALKSDGILAMKSAGQQLAETIAAVPEEVMTAKFQMPWGEELTGYQLANLTVNHILYHDGQLNFLQCLHGDQQMHWFDA